MAVKLLQDIHLSDKELWSNFQVYWNEGNYVAAVNLLNANQQLVTKYVSANWLNGLTALVYLLENNSDPTFKADRINVSYVPSSLDTGEVYFELQEGSSVINVKVGAIGSSATSTTIGYNGTFINAIAFQNLQQVEANIGLSGNFAIFSVAEAPEDTITCLVFSSSDVDSTVNGISYPTTTKTISFTGTLLNAYAVMSGSIIQCDITVGSNQVVFNIPSLASGNSVNCYVVSIDTDYILEGEVNKDTGTISTSSTSTTLDCDGYLINHILTQNNNIIKTDVELVGTEVVISTTEQPSSTINATVYYT